MKNPFKQFLVRRAEQKRIANHRAMMQRAGEEHALWLEATRKLEVHWFMLYCEAYLEGLPDITPELLHHFANRLSQMADRLESGGMARAPLPQLDWDETIYDTTETRQ